MSIYVKVGDETIRVSGPKGDEGKFMSSEPIPVETLEHEIANARARQGLVAHADVAATAWAAADREVTRLKVLWDEAGKAWKDASDTYPEGFNWLESDVRKNLEQAAGAAYQAWKDGAARANDALEAFKMAARATPTEPSDPVEQADLVRVPSDRTRVGSYALHDERDVVVAQRAFSAGRAAGVTSQGLAFIKGIETLKKALLEAANHCENHNQEYQHSTPSSLIAGWRALAGDVIPSTLGDTADDILDKPCPRTGVFLKPGSPVSRYVQVIGSNVIAELDSYVVAADFTVALEELSRWQRWASDLLHEPAGDCERTGEVADEMRKKITAVVEAPAVIGVDETEQDLWASAAAWLRTALQTSLRHVDPFLVEACTHVAHEVYREALNGDDMPPWEHSPEGLKETSRDVVRTALKGTTPRQWHAKWRAEKVVDGWSYGPVRDEEAKKHPNMVSYDKLTSGQRSLDSLFVTTVNATRKAFGDFRAALGAIPVMKGGDVSPEDIEKLKQELSGSAWHTPISSADDVSFLPALWVLEKLFEKHCECRPLNTARVSHSHDCDTGITDDVRTIVHRFVIAGEGEPVVGTSEFPWYRAATDEEVRDALKRLGDERRFGGDPK